jgi:myosin protein heavy chain
LKNSTIDFSILSYASESTPAKTPESLKEEVKAVNRELTLMKKEWYEERRQLLGDNAVLKDAANRLNLQMQEAEQRAEQKERRNEKARNGVLDVWFFFIFFVECFSNSSNLQELDEAKQTIADLEEDLKAERSRLRVLTVEETHIEREKENVLLQLRRTESDMEDVKLQLQRVKRNNNELEGELRGASCCKPRTNPS